LVLFQDNFTLQIKRHVDKVQANVINEYKPALPFLCISKSTTATSCQNYFVVNLNHDHSSLSIIAIEFFNTCFKSCLISERMCQLNSENCGQPQIFDTFPVFLQTSSFRRKSKTYMYIYTCCMKMKTQKFMHPSGLLV
jgi:hypothetical protein